MREEPAGIKERELTSARSPAVIAVAVLALLACLYALLETALKALGQKALLAAPETWWAWGLTLPERLEPAAGTGLGLGAMGLGLLLLVHGLRRGRRARHGLACEDAVLVVDDQVLAASLARRARAEAGVGPGQAVVTVHRDRVEAQLSPTSGTPIDPALVAAGLDDELRTNRVEPQLQVFVRVSTRGVIGQ